MTGMIAVGVWVVLAALLFILEGVTTQLVGIWFAAGAVVAVIPAAFGAPLWFQLLVFLLCSLLFLYLIRPVVREKISVKRQPTNADMVIGQRGIVFEEIDNLAGTGRVTAMGLTWSARADAQDQIIPKGSEITVERLEGAKVIVNLSKTASTIVR